MSMVYTLAMQLKESLTELLTAKAAARELEEQAAMLKVQEVRTENRLLNSNDMSDALEYYRKRWQRRRGHL